MPTPHLDDEQLSAVLDAGAPDPHVDVCASCADRLDAMRAAVALVAAPVPPLPADAVDRLVAHALSAEGPRRRQTAGIPASLVALAALVALVLGVPALLTATGGVDSRDEVATGSDDAVEETEASTDAAGGTGVETAGSGAATGGVVADATAEALSSGSAGGAGGSAFLGSFDDDASLVQALVATLSQRAQDADSTAHEQARGCEPEARGVAAGRVSTLAYAAFVAWRGQDAQVLVFVLTEPIEGATRQAYVMSASCSLLAEPRF